MKLFISYAHVDKPIIKDWIVDKLTAGGHEVWFDSHLSAGQEWRQQLSNAIEHSEALVYCMTPEAIVSEWCQWELAKAVELGKPVVPVLIQARTKIPESLSQLQYVDFSDGPTGDAVARLMGGLQQLSPLQIPSAPTNPQGIPPHAIKDGNFIMKFLRDPAVQAIIAMIGLVISVITFHVSNGDSFSPQPTQSAVQPTASSPIIVAIRDLDIRNGPDAEFTTIGILSIGSSLDILGISEDRLWYQVLLSDGRRGWVLTTSNDVRLEGDRGVISVIIPTLIPSHTPTETSTPTNTANETATLTDVPTTTDILTSTVTNTDTPSHTPTNTYTAQPTNTQESTLTPIPSLTHTVTPAPQATNTVISQSINGQYPCTGIITSSGTSQQLHIIYVRAS